MAYFGVDLDVRIKELNLQFKNTLRNKGDLGLRSLSSVFKSMDVNGNGKLDTEEFE
jgi:hypothetical protein